MSEATPRFSGVANIVRFNRGKYLAATVAVIALLAVAAVGTSLRMPALIAAGAVVIGVATSLGVSFWVYDASDLYDFRWSSIIQDGDRVAVVHAGFDEVSETLRTRHDAHFHTVSFYNRLEITEASIRRAQGHTPEPAIASAEAGRPVVETGGYDCVVAFMCLHELRTEHARQELLAELGDGLAKGGKLVVVEHLRDLPNAVAFSIGVLHFMSRSSWMADFAAARLQIVSEKKITPFVSEFVLAGSTHS